MKKILVILGIILVLVVIFFLMFIDRTDDTIEDEVIYNDDIIREFNCNDIFRGAIVPYQDEQIIFDDQYIDAATTGLTEYDMERVPDKVRSYMSQGYQCDAYIPSYSDGSTIEWGCYLYYSEYRFLYSDDLEGKSELEDRGFVCSEQDCFMESGEFLWSCVKE